MKKYIKWGAGVVAAPIVLFVIVGILIYLPPIQNFLVGKVARIASETSGMNIQVGRLSLSFPLDMVVSEVRAVDKGDTLLAVDRMTVEIRLLPLLKKQVEIDGVRLHGASVNSLGLIEGMRLQGKVGELFFNSHSVALSPETAVINNFLLRDSHLSLCLADTAAADTSATSPVYWKIDLQKVDFERVSFTMNMPLDTLGFRLALDKATLRDGHVDLHRSAYSARSFSLLGAEIDLDMDSSPVDSGFDPAHLRMRDINIGIDSMFYAGNHIRAAIHRFELKEQSGLEVVSSEGRLQADEQTIRIPSFELKTPASYLTFEADADWSVASGNSDGTVRGRFMAEIGKTDLFKFVAGMPENFVKRFPSAPLRVQTGVDGSLKNLKLTGINVSIPGSFDFRADGNLTHILDSVKRKGTIRLDAGFSDMNFLKEITGGMVIPAGTVFNGSVELDGNNFSTDLVLQKDAGKMILSGGYSLAKSAYRADLQVSGLDLHSFLPDDSLFLVSASLSARGSGFDFFDSATRMEAEARIDHLEYGNRSFSGANLKAALNRSRVVADLAVKDNVLDVSSRLEALLRPERIEADCSVNVRQLDLYGMKLVQNPLKTSEDITIHLNTDLKHAHEARMSVRNTRMITAEKTFKPKDINLGVKTSRDSVRCFANAGDLVFLFRSQEGVDGLTARFTQLGNEVTRQWKEKYIDQAAVRSLFPSATFHVFAGTDNPFANMLAANKVNLSKLSVKLETSPETGLQGAANLYGLRTDSLALDTIFFRAVQDTAKIEYHGGVIAGNKPFQEAFSVLLDGDVASSDARMAIYYLNGKGERGAHIGFLARLQEKGISLHVSPENPTLVYRPFRVNPGNYVYLSDEGRISADLSIFDSRHTGLRFYSAPDSTVQQDLTLSLNRIDIAEFRRIIPYMPDVAGIMSAEGHYVQAGEQMQVSADLSVDRLMYNRQPLGNWALSGAYLPLETGEHCVDGFVMLDGREIVSWNGEYLLANEEKQTDDHLSAEMDLHHFPLRLANAFIPDRMAILSGDIDGTMRVAGKTDRLLMNGEVNLDSVNVNIPQASLNLQFDNRPVRMADSKLYFDKFKILTYGKNPFIIDGNVDMTDFSAMKLDLKMDARNFELLNAKRTKESMVYGKLYLDVNATLKGTLDELRMRGNANILGTSDFTYIMQESPLSVEDRLGETVTFVNFKDTTSAARRVVPELSLGGMDLLMTLHIDEAVQCRVDMDEQGSNYMKFEGGGDLSFQYTPAGSMLLNGRYSLMSGELKYEMPVIPLKTFHIRSGSYIEWTGNIMNPNLNIQAAERVRASVAQEGQNSRTVNFDVGVNITNRLDNLGFTFTLEAPDDGSVQNELAGMSAAEKNKLAVTMLVTGMYMAEGNTGGGGGLSANSVLNSFLQGEINKVAGSALKTIDVNFGMEQTEQAEDGSTRTDYNFQFAKRFWNNRFRIVIGGKISTGNNTSGQEESFIDNVSIEYRLDNSGTRYIKVFHDKNYESVLDGEVIETGAGIVLRKKISKLSELFIFRKKKKEYKENAED